jgi:hypothetical protein
MYYCTHCEVDIEDWDVVIDNDTHYCDTIYLCPNCYSEVQYTY